jgi:PilZ domain-containing protein
MPLERRRPSHIRFPVRVPALMIEGAKPWGHPTPGETRNISRGGARLRVEEPTIPSNPVGLTLRLVYRPPLTLTGTVVWSAGQPDPPGWDLGIQFTEEINQRQVAEIADEGFKAGAGPSE